MLLLYILPVPLPYAIAEIFRKFCFLLSLVNFFYSTECFCNTEVAELGEILSSDNYQLAVQTQQKIIILVLVIVCAMLCCLFLQLQAWWKGVMVRKGLGPYAKKKKGKKKGKGKGKGKKGKKGKKKK